MAGAKRDSQAYTVTCIIHPRSHEDEEDKQRPLPTFSFALAHQLTIHHHARHHPRKRTRERGREGGREGKKESESERVSERERETSHTHTRSLALSHTHPSPLTPLPSSPSSGCPPEHARTAPGMSSGWKMMKRMRRPSQTQRRCDTRCCASFPPWCCSCSLSVVSESSKAEGWRYRRKGRTENGMAGRW